jgi:hypothetical protein
MSFGVSEYSTLSRYPCTHKAVRLSPGADKEVVLPLFFSKMFSGYLGAVTFLLIFIYLSTLTVSYHCETEHWRLGIKYSP